MLAFFIMVDEAFEPGTPLPGWQRRIGLARITTVLRQAQVPDGILFPAGTEIVWKDPSHRRVAAARLPFPPEILGIRATALRRVVEGGRIVLQISRSRHLTAAEVP